MADDGKSGEQGQQETPNPEAKKEQDDTVTIRRGEYSGLKTQIKQLAKQLEEHANTKAAEEAEKLKAAQNWEALEKKKTAELDAMRSEMATMRRSVLTEKARAALLGAGIRAGLAAEGALSTLPTDIESDGIAAWVEATKAANPDAFGAPVVPIGAPSVGPTGRPTSDPAAALKAKWDAARSKGPDAMLAVKREIDAHIASTGKNPLA